jgi:N-acetylneuraminic acid mutarotase
VTNSTSRKMRLLVAFLGALMLAACGGGGSGSTAAPINPVPPQAYSVSATVSGLAGTGLALELNAGSETPVSVNGTVTFATMLASGSSYSVTIAAQPTAPAQTCVAGNASGTVGSSNVAGVTVTCTTNSYTIGGTISGLGAPGLVLANGNTSVSPAANATSFAFSSAVPSGAAYAVTVQTQPSGETCSVTGGSGTIGSSNVVSIAVGCVANATNTYSVGGTINGLTAAGLVLANGNATVAPAANTTSFTFPTPAPSGTAYAVTVKTQPTGQTCSVTSGSGTVGSANVTNVAVGCVANTASTYTVGGTISGLTAAGLVLANGNATVSPAANATAFTFPTPVPSGTAYAITVKTQPSGETCSVTGGSGTVGSANVVNVAVACVANTYTIGGTISGLSAAGLVLANGIATVSPAANAATFTFPTRVPSGTAYSITVKTQPSALTCSVSNASGTIGNSNVTNITVSCSTSIYTVGGGLTGLTGAGLVLQDNGTDSSSIAAGTTSFTFATSLATGAHYQVTIKAQPAGQFCSVAGGAGTIASANITSVIITCIASAQWIWEGGATSVDAAGVYGVKGAAAAGNVPGARGAGLTWTDKSGNLWMFGGYGYDSSGTSAADLNDLWKFTPSTYQWTWVSGSKTGNAGSTYGTEGTAAPANVPGSRFGAFRWIDSSGALWLFGGQGYDPNSGTAVFLNDLWKFVPTTGLWTWMGGSALPNTYGVYGTQGVAAAGNLPGGRYSGVSWVDHSGNFWLFGGVGLDGAATENHLNDLWEYKASTGLWTWVSGSQTGGAGGVYGMQGTAASTNVPGAREQPVSWADSSGNLWLSGGFGISSTPTLGFLNDLWMYAPTAGNWTWMSGSATPNALPVFGTQGVAATSNVPGARISATSWIDGLGTLWLFGGNGYDSTGATNDLNDLWTFNPASKQWTWINGSQSGGEYGVYGTLGTPAAINVPGSRSSAVSWTDSANNLWLFGGNGASGLQGNQYSFDYLNDLWNYGITSPRVTPAVVLHIAPSSPSLVVNGTTTLSVTATDGSGNPIATPPNLQWQSLDMSVATVAAGVVTGVALGTATVTVTDPVSMATASVTVSINAIAAGIYIANFPVNVTLGPTSGCVWNRVDTLSMTITIAADGSVTASISDTAPGISAGCFAIGPFASSGSGALTVSGSSVSGYINVWLPANGGTYGYQIAATASGNQIAGTATLQSTDPYSGAGPFTAAKQ